MKTQNKNFKENLKGYFNHKVKREKKKEMTKQTNKIFLNIFTLVLKEEHDLKRDPISLFDCTFFDLFLPLPPHN